MNSSKAKVNVSFGINLSFLIKPFFYIIKKLGQKCNYISRSNRAVDTKLAEQLTLAPIQLTLS